MKTYKQKEIEQSKIIIKHNGGCIGICPDCCFTVVCNLGISTNESFLIEAHKILREDN